MNRFNTKLAEIFRGFDSFKPPIVSGYFEKEAQRTIDVYLYWKSDERYWPSNVIIFKLFSNWYTSVEKPLRKSGGGVVTNTRNLLGVKTFKKVYFGFTSRLVVRLWMRPWWLWWRGAAWSSGSSRLLVQSTNPGGPAVFVAPPADPPALLTASRAATWWTA